MHHWLKPLKEANTKRYWTVLICRTTTRHLCTSCCMCIHHWLQIMMNICHLKCFKFPHLQAFHVSVAQSYQEVVALWIRPEWNCSILCKMCIKVRKCDFWWDVLTLSGHFLFCWFPLKHSHSSEWETERPMGAGPGRAGPSWMENQGSDRKAHSF